ncbi:MAG: S-methyl-5-thioribose-1-phosphate isomerase [Defluviitaleaceae bacterium]|nr:S-methyl-5-thioribose-1-phosphate isomerase [Defluviitaleaceae bacterium]
MHPPQTLYLDNPNSAVVILDQTLLPHTIKYLHLTTISQVWTAIKDLQVRGAPAIGVTAALGLYIHMKTHAANSADPAAFAQEFKSASAYLSTARPTAVNLDWALNQMYICYQANKHSPITEIINSLHQAAQDIQTNDTKICRRIGQHGAALLKHDMGILTHCNAGALAATKYGTALAPIYIAHEQGINLRVYADETRPVLQGARLTAFELHQANIDVTLICDNMAATVMSKGLIDAVFVGCDRVAANGDTANKVGTHGVAILAKHFNIPFYVCAPLSTIDMSTKTGTEIIIEEREPAEITSLWYTSPMAPKGVKVYNPSFDVTTASLITGFITEIGIIKPPFNL